MFLDKSISPEPWTELPMSSEPSPTTTSRFLDLMASRTPQPPSNPPPTLTTFHLFPTLPSEIRQHIFRLSLPPRVLALSYNPVSNTFTTSTLPPTLLRVSQEARLATLQLYVPSFGTSSSPAKTYFNPYIDTIYLPRLGEMGYDESLRNFRSLVCDPFHHLSSLRSVAIDHVNLDIKRPWEGYNKASFLRSFKNLEEVILGMEENPREEEAVKVFTEPRLSPEKQLRMWWVFRQTFAGEERVLKDVSAEMGRAYEAFNLPIVKLRGKQVFGGEIGIETACGELEI